MGLGGGFFQSFACEIKRKGDGREFYIKRTRGVLLIGKVAGQEPRECTPCPDKQSKETGLGDASFNSERGIVV